MARLRVANLLVPTIAALPPAAMPLGTPPKIRRLRPKRGNSLAIASLERGQTVLDLGSGAGFDCFLAARGVGPTGKVIGVIGVNMTPEMLTKARENAKRSGFDNVEFRLGEIEALPVADESVDVIVSNCVINLSPQKEPVFREAFRVLRTGGRLAVADIVATAPLREEVKRDWAAYTGCMAGATEIDELEKMLGSAFDRIKVAPKDASRSFIREWPPRQAGRGISSFGNNRSNKAALFLMADRPTKKRADD
jgi:arsenite methyltransferase